MRLREKAGKRHAMPRHHNLEEYLTAYIDGGSLRAAAAGIKTKLGNHSFRATGITASLKNGGTLEKTAPMANYASTRTTQLYDRRRDEVSLDEVERIVIYDCLFCAVSRPRQLQARSRRVRPFLPTVTASCHFSCSGRPKGRSSPRETIRNTRNIGALLRETNK